MDTYGKSVHIWKQFKITYSQLLIIQDKFLDIPLTDNATQHSVTNVHCSRFVDNKTFHKRYNASG